MTRNTQLARAHTKDVSVPRKVDLVLLAATNVGYLAHNLMLLGP